MSNSLYKILGNSSALIGVSEYDKFKTLSSSLETTESAADAPSFSLVMKQLYSNIDTAMARTTTNSYSFSTPYNRISVKTPAQASKTSENTLVTPNISSIVRQIKRNKNSVIDIDSQIREYLLTNYGGSTTEVIKNLSGIQNLPSQAIAMQDMLFEQIVTKISTQVRGEIYNSYDVSDISNLYSDDTESDTSSVSDSSGYGSVLY
jgi:hypothetical protein